MHPEGLRPEVALCDLCFILSHNTKPKELKKKKKELLLQGICCNVHVNTELLNCPVHLVLFNMSFSSEWLFDSLKFLLLLPALTIQNGNDLFVNGFSLQARLAHKGNHHLSQQMFAPKCAARRCPGCTGNIPQSPSCETSCRTEGTSHLLSAQHLPHLLLATTGGWMHEEVSQKTEGCLPG